MALPEGDPKQSPRRPRSAKRKSRRAPAKTRNRKTRNRKTTDMVGLIDAQFNRRVTTTENGKSSRITVFEAIYKQLWTREMGGDARALKVRLKYDVFARKLQPERQRQVIVQGGLNDRLSKCDPPPMIEDDDDV